MAFDLGDYVDVAERIAELRDKYPDARLRPLDWNHPYRIETIGDRTFVVVVAACFLTPDSLPGVGMAWEPFPGTTPYTKNSELQNAETSAWGRAIVAALVADTKRGVASRDEVRNRRAEPEPDPFVPATRLSRIPTPLVDKAKRDRIRDLIEKSEDPAAVKSGWKDVPLPKLERLTVDRLDAALKYLKSVGIEVDELPQQTALVGCPHCGAEITSESNRLATWDDPTSEEDPPARIAGCDSCKPFSNPEGGQ